MDNAVIAIGDKNVIKKLVQDMIYVENDDIVLIYASPKESRSIIKSLSESGINACTYSNAYKIINTTQKFSLLKEYDRSTVFDWLKTGFEYFSILSSGCFELYSIDSKEVHSITKVEPITKSVFSNSGAIIAFIRGTILSLHVNSTLDKIFDVKAKDPINSAIFDHKDRFVAVTTEFELQVYDVKKGTLLFNSKAQEFNFTRDGLFLVEEKRELILDETADIECRTKNMKLGYPNSSFKTSKNGKEASFIDDNLQKIIFDDGKTETIKSHMNIKSVQFYFGENRLFAIIKKVIDKQENYIIESYHNKEITSNILESPPLSMAVSDNSFIIFDISKKMTFYEKDKYGFKPVKSIKKDGGVILSKFNETSCVYDEYTDNIEFYDKGELRSVYTHQGCTDIIWSNSKLYVSTFTSTIESGGLLQIFNCDGKLMFKKTINKLNEFVWRPFIKLSDEEKTRIVKENPISELDEDFNDHSCDVETLLSEWKGYLLSKIQKINT